MDNKIEPISDKDPDLIPIMCEIRFDCLVKMFDMAIQPQSNLVPFKVKREIPRKPQWFKNTARISLEHIRYSDEYVLGKMLKDMYKQLELHIKQYEENYLK